MRDEGGNRQVGVRVRATFWQCGKGEGEGEIRSVQRRSNLCLTLRGWPGAGRRVVDDEDGGGPSRDARRGQAAPLSLVVWAAGGRIGSDRRMDQIKSAVPSQASHSRKIQVHAEAGKPALTMTATAIGL